MAHALMYEPDTPMTRDEFLARVDQQPSGRFERIDGIVVARTPNAPPTTCAKARRAMPCEPPSGRRARRPARSSATV